MKRTHCLLAALLCYAVLLDRADLPEENASMSRRRLRELLRGPDQVKRFRTVTAILPRDRYEVVDQSGRVSIVEASALHRVGDQVTVIDGRIVGPARRFARRKIYRV